MSDFQKELEKLINKHSKENGSNTPDFLLAEYLIGCLETYNKTVQQREKWLGGVEQFISVSELGK